MAESSGSAPTRVSESIYEILAPYIDQPRGWVFDNKEKLELLIDRWGGKTVIDSLKNCLDAGKLDYFFHDFGRFRPEERPASDYYPFTPQDFYRPTDQEIETAHEMASAFRKAHGMKEFKP